LIKNLFLLKAYGAKRLIKESPTKNWKKTTLSDFMKRLRDTGSAERRTARTDNINAVDELVLSQEDAPQSHHTTQQIDRETWIHHSSVFRIIRQDLRLKCVKKTPSTANCVPRLTRARQLLRRFPQSAADFITARRNTRIASAVVAIAIPSVRPFVCPSVTRPYCVKTTARSTVQFALSDSKMCLVLYKPKNIPHGRPLPLKFGSN